MKLKLIRWFGRFPTPRRSYERHNPCVGGRGRAISGRGHAVAFSRGCALWECLRHQRRGDRACGHHHSRKPLSGYVVAGLAPVFMKANAVICFLNLSESLKK